MAKKRINRLLLMVFVFAAICVLGTGRAQARYLNTVTWDTMVDETLNQDQVTSDLLENVKNPEVTILLGDLIQYGTINNQGNLEYSVNFTLRSSVAAVGQLNWAVDQYEYVQARMFLEDTELQPGMDLEIPGNVQGITLTMVLSPTAKSMNETHQAMPVNIQVAWGNTLRGNFLTILGAQEAGNWLPLLPEETGEDVEPTQDPTQPSQPEEPDPAEPTQPENSDPAESAEPENTQPVDSPETEATEPSDPVPAEEALNPEQTDPEALTEDPQPEASDSAQQNQENTQNTPSLVHISNNSQFFAVPDPEATREIIPKTYREEYQVAAGEGETEEDPSAGDTGDSDVTTDAGTTGDGSNLGDGTEDSGETSEETEEELPAPKVDIITTRSFKTDDVLLVEVQMQGWMTSVQLGMGFRNIPEEEDGIEPIPFPKNLRYSLDGGTTYYHLYQDALIPLSANPSSQVFVVLDWSRINLTAAEVELSAAAYQNTEMVASDRETTAPQIQYKVTASTRILDTENPLTIHIPQSWQGYTLEYEVQMLTSPLLADGSYGPAVYQPLDLGEETEEDPEAPTEESTEENPGEPPKKTLILEQTDAGLEIQIGEALPPAGTYRIEMTWKTGDTVAEHAQVIFYINYTVNKETMMTGGAEQ